MTLIVVGGPLVAEDVGVVLRRLEERVARIVERLRQGVRTRARAPRRGARRERQRQPVEPGVADRIGTG